MTIPTLLQFAAFIGTPFFVNWIISNFLDQLPQWNNWTSSGGKRAITLGLAIGLGLLSSALVNSIIPGLSPDMLLKLQSIFAVIAAAVSAWLAGDIQHNVVGPWASARRARLVARKMQFTIEVKSLRDGKSLLPNG